MNMLYWRRLKTTVWDHKSLWNQLTELINQVRRLIFILTFIQTDFFLQPVESPSTGQSEKCRFKALPHWLPFSELHAAAWWYLYYKWGKYKLIFLLSEIGRTSLLSCRWGSNTFYRKSMDIMGLHTSYLSDHIISNILLIVEVCVTPLSSSE